MDMPCRGTCHAMEKPMKDYDAVVVGSGTAGQTVAYDLNEKGLKIAVVERSAHPGGTCALSGCQPKKYYYEVMETVARCRHLAGKGIVSPPVSSWPQAKAQKDAFTSRISERTVQAFQDAGIAYLPGTAHFHDEETLAIEGRPIRAGYFVLATGARPMHLPFSGSDLLMTSDQFLDLPDLPSRIVFVGGGFISFEFAHFAARLGTENKEVHIIEVMDRPLGPFDKEMVELLVEASREEDIAVHTGVQIVSVQKHEKGFALTTASGDQFAADLVVHGAGRVPNMEDLNLDAAGIAYTSRGITVDAFMRTSNQRVYAVGDCAATIQLARIADYEAHVAAEAILADIHHTTATGMSYEAAPSILFTYPQYGMIGKTEDTLRSDGTEYYKSAADHLGWPTYRRIGLKHAAYKILAGRDGRILGTHFLSDSATGLVNTVKHAMLCGLTVDELRRQSIVSPYPSRESDLIYMLEPLLP